MSTPGGPLTATGDLAERTRLVAALTASTPEHDDPENPSARQWTHGFHSYPARFHPLLVRHLLAGTPAGSQLLDPFAGSGTTLVEGMVAGLHSRGIDLNPLGVALARVKTTLLDTDQLAALVDTARTVADASFDRVRTRARTAESGERYDNPVHYAPHVFRELVGLREEIESVAEPLRNILLLALSAIVIKVSRQPSETAAGEVERKIGKNLPTQLFVRKIEELALRLHQLASVVPEGTPTPELRIGDARRLLYVAESSIDLVVTSPPYLGTYDYADQHRRRFGWLGLDATRFGKDEIGARRKIGDPSSGLAAWQRDVNAFVGEIGRVLKPGARAYIVIGDSALGHEIVPGDAAVTSAAEVAGLTMVATAAQARPNFYADARRATRSEHLLALRKP